jgi:nucleoside-diphosphate-sugar epimerase
LVRELIRRGHTVAALMRNRSPDRRTADWIDRVEIVHGSFDDTTALRECLSVAPGDVFFHLAWTGVKADFRNQAYQISTNVAGTLHLWELANQSGCKHWIGLGSQAEYGFYQCALHENLPTRPVSAYGVAKLACGMLTAKMSELAGMRHSTVRLVSAYGPGDDPRTMISSIIKTLLDGGTPAMTKGEQVWDYLYVDDAARALCSIAESGAVGVFNLASGTTVRIREVAEQIRDLIDPHLSLGLGQLPYRPDQIMHLEGDISRLTSATGWMPQVSLEEGLLRAVEWYRSGSHDARK